MIGENMIGGEASTLEAVFETGPVARLAGAEKVLVVEDEKFVRDVACEVLRSAGYEVLHAISATEAASVFEHSLCDLDLLVTDLVLPGENGRVLAEKLRQKNPALRVLFITGYPSQMRGGMSERENCLGKPFSAAELLRRARQALDRIAPQAGRMTLAESPARRS